MSLLMVIGLIILAGVLFNDPVQPPKDKTLDKDYRNAVELLKSLKRMSK